MSADNDCSIVFLGIDGVPRSFGYEKYLMDHDVDWYDENGAIFDPHCVNALDKLENMTHARIVIYPIWFMYNYR